MSKLQYKIVRDSDSTYLVADNKDVIYGDSLTHSEAVTLRHHLANDQKLELLEKEPSHYD